MKNKIVAFGLVGLLIAIGLFGLRFMPKKPTTTPDDFLNNTEVSSQTYLNDRSQVIKTVDSLLSTEMIYKPAEKALRYFNGKRYEDTVDRQWAIDLPMKSVTYLKHFVDTIFYKPTNNNEFAGLLISKTSNELSGIEYFGNGFICKRNKQTLQLKIKGYRVTGSETIDQCRAALHDIYFREMGFVNGSFNLNDMRYWMSKDVLNVKWDLGPS